MGSVGDWSRKMTDVERGRSMITSAISTSYKEKPH
jgi:hypothetical protein